MCDTTGVTSLSLRNPQDLSPIGKEDLHNSHHSNHHTPTLKLSKHTNNHNNNNNNNNDIVQQNTKQNQVGSVMLFGVPIVSLVMDGKERLCLAQISSTLLKDFSYNEIHNRRVALGITCVQCTPVQLEILRRAGAMPVTSRRCGMITRREAERLCQSFLGDHAPPQLPENFAFEVYHECGWGSRGSFVPSRYNSSRAKCIRCTYCQLFFSPNKFIFHSHRLPESRYVQPDAANFNSWRRHLKLCGDPPDEELSPTTLSMDTTQVVMAWEDVRAMFNGGTRKRMLAAHSSHHHHSSRHSDNHRRLSNLAHGIKSPPNPNSNTNTNGSSRGGTTQQNRHQTHHQNNPNSQNNSNTSSSSSNQIINPGFNSETSQSSIGITSQNNFLTVPSPLLSPATRLDTIWNPGLTSPTGNNNNSNSNSIRQCISNLGGATPMPHLPFHPLSIPWLRRPLFPFPHPFSPAACHLLAADPNGLSSSAEKLASLSAGRQINQSAFKPVSRTAEHLFTWLNNSNNTLGNPGGLSLPEDLSLNSISNIHSLSNNNLLKPSENPLIATSITGDRQPQGHSSVSSTNDDENDTLLDPNRKTSVSPCRPSRKQGGLNFRHQIQMMSSAMENETDDEENVDIESTEVEEEECSSTSTHIWVTSGGGGGHPSHHHNNQKRKRSRSASPNSSESCSEGEDETQIITPLITKGIEKKNKKNNMEEEVEEESKPVVAVNGNSLKKRKRLWDFDTSKESLKKGGLNEMSPTSPTTINRRELLESKD